MEKIKFKKHKKKWDKMSELWGKFTKSGRPSRDDIKNYDQLIKEALKDIKHPKIIVLGATPEIRDCLYKYKVRQKAQITCVDMTRDMYRAMDGYLKHKNETEKFINLNWLNLSQKIKTASIDVVIGDYVICNVGGSEDVFFKEIAKVLKEGGSFINRARFIDGAKKKIDFYREFKRISSLVKKKKMSTKEAAAFFQDQLVLHSWYLNKNNKTSLSLIDEKIYAVLDKKIKENKDRVENAILDHFYDSWYSIKEKYWTDYPRAVLEKKIRKYFRIKRTLFSKDYEVAKQSPIYRLSKIRH